MWVSLTLAVVGLGWLSDAITLQGEWTLYTAECGNGNWKGASCSGRMTAGARYRYRALKPHGEVVFWMVGSAEPSGKLTACAIEDGRNWACKPAGDFARSPTLQIVRGSPVFARNGHRAVHTVRKSAWLLLKYGLWPGNTADS